MKYPLILTALLAGSCFMANAQNAKPEDTEIWEPVPKVVTPGKNLGDAPSDAIILFNGKGLDEWVSVEDKTPAKWLVKGDVLTVNKATGNIETKKVLATTNCTLSGKYLQTLQAADRPAATAACS